MIIKRIFNRRTFVIFFLAVLLFELFTPIVSRAVTSSSTVLSYDDSSIDDDLKYMDIKNYPKNDLGECSVIGFMEYCYTENTMYRDYYGLYVYVYNPTEKPLIERNGVSEIQMSDSFDEDGKKAGTANYKLIHLDHTDNFRFYKFKVAESADKKSQYALAKWYSDRFNGRRRYEITAVNLAHEGSLKTTSYGVSKIYEFSGYSAWCGDPPIAISTLECKNFGGEDVHLNVFDTNYRSSVSKGDNLYDDLQSVYFSLPDEYADQWGYLSKITAEWYEYKTVPMFVTKDMEAYSALYEMRNKLIDIYGREIDVNGNIKDEKTLTYWRVLWDITSYNAHSDFGSGDMKYFIGSAYNGYCRDDIDDDDLVDMDNSPNWSFGYYDKDNQKIYDVWFPLNILHFLFPIEKEPDSILDYQVSSDAVKKYIEEYADEFNISDLLHDRYPSVLFERYDGDGHKTNSYYITDVFDYIDKNENRNFWEKLWGMNETSSEKYSPIVTISKGDLYLSPEDFSKKYLVNIEDAEDIIGWSSDSYASDETPYLLRFAKTDYYASEARFDEAEDDYFNMSSVDGYVAQEHVFLDFDILSLEYTSTDGANKTVVGVVADSIDIINGLTPPADIPIEEEEWWQKIMALLLLLVILKLLSFFIGPLKVVFSIVSYGAKVLISFAFYILKLPFKLLFLPFRRR